jgi:alpha-mannosidase
MLPVRRKNLAPLPLESSFVAVEGGALVLSALKESEDGTGIILRVYNPGPVEAEGVLRCSRGVKKADIVNLDESVSGDAAVASGSGGASIPLRVGACGILTLCIRF